MNSFSRVHEKIVIRSADEATVALLEKELSIPRALAQVLSARNLKTFEACKTFFRPDASQFHDPFLFEQMERVVSRIDKAIAAGEKIIVYGDYDVDGITSTVLMIRVLTALGANCTYFLPNRLTDGYGLSEEGIRKIADSGVTLIITVDCGISSVREIAIASCLGIDCIVTDHHDVHQELPQAFALINPKVPGCTYPYRFLAGVGVALKVCQALAKHYARGNELWEPYLDIVALGTAADIVPLSGENRVIASLGFTAMQNTVHLGLSALISQQGLTGKKISTSQVVFQIAPCINAVGRLGKPDAGVKMLLADDAAEAARYAEELRSANTERREIDRVVAEEAYEWVVKNTDIEKDVVVVAGSEAWHAGVIGIVASKMVERYNRPAILFSMSNDGYARGSGRSIPALDLLEALNKCADLLEGYGGHAAAAGMTIKTANIAAFRERLNTTVSSMLSPEDFIPVVVADAEVPIPAITPKFYRIIQQMEPFGPGNMRPVFYSGNVTHRTVPRLLGNAHVKMSLAGEGIVMDAIAFNWGDRYRPIKEASTLSVAYTIDQNEWNGKTSLQMKVKGITI